MVGDMWILSLLILAAMIYAVVDIVLRDDSEVKHLPRIVWLFLVILIPFLGIILWFTVGREHSERVARPQPRPRAMAPQAAAPAAAPSPGAGYDVRSTEQQLADLEREIEEERLRAEVARKRAERDGRTGA